MRMRFLAASALIAIGASSGIASAAGPGEVGGPPTEPIFCDAVIKPCGKPVVLAVHDWFNGALEAVGYSSALGPCIEYRQADGSGTGTCGGNTRPPGGDPISLDAIAKTGHEGGQPGYTEVFGTLRPDVAGVRFRYRKHGRLHRLDALVGQLGDDLIQRIGGERPFGIVEVTVPGCIPGRRFRVSAYDAAGALLGRTRIRLGGGCANFAAGGSSAAAQARGYVLSSASAAASTRAATAPSRTATTP